MATKDELLAFAEAHGIGVDSSMLKADIEAAISDAGYDPYTLEDEPMGTEEPDETPVEMRTSSDAAYSTYTRVDPDPDERPVPGHTVEQERGSTEDIPVAPSE